MLSDQQIERYSRQIVMRQVGGVGQQKLSTAQVAILGHGEAAATAAVYLAAAGVGRLLVSELSAHALVDVNPDCAIEQLPPLSVDGSSEEVTQRCAAIVSTQQEMGGLSALRKQCCVRQVPMFWGGEGGLWTRLSPAGGAADLCLSCLLAGGDTSSAVAAFWVGSQLSAAAVAAVLGWPLPDRVQSWGELAGDGWAPPMACTHAVSRGGS